LRLIVTKRGNFNIVNYEKNFDDEWKVEFLDLWDKIVFVLAKFVLG